MNLNKFVERYCDSCGSQRCNPYNPEWLKGCRKYYEIKEKEKMPVKEGKYTFYTDGMSKVIAVSTYEGRTVRGVAKCDPRDGFDLEKGKRLAEARCSEKIAAKRAKRAKRELKKAENAFHAAEKRLYKMQDYNSDSKIALGNAVKKIEKLMSEM